MNVWLVVAAAAITVVITYGSIFGGLRTYPRHATHWFWRGWQFFWSCPLCVGFWVGALSWELHEIARAGWEGRTLGLVPVFEVFEYGAMTGVLALLVKLVILRLDGN